ncbi:type II toxin-antitoxin system RelE/ParE family toxin [Methylobacterium sp. A54F]
MIRSFRCKHTQALLAGEGCHRAWRAFAAVAERKLDLLDAAAEIGDLRSPPGNRLEKLSGDRNGQWSIRINDQWRICFRWSENGPEDVEIVDYH